MAEMALVREANFERNLSYGQLGRQQENLGTFHPPHEDETVRWCAGGLAKRLTEMMKAPVGYAREGGNGQIVSQMCFDIVDYALEPPHTKAATRRFRI